jgi:PAS domain S-box-containing protein
MQESEAMSQIAPEASIVDTAQRQPGAVAPAEYQRHLDRLFETMAEGVVLIAPDGRIIQANAAADWILGLARSEIEGRAYDSETWKILRLDGTPMPPEEMASNRALKEKRQVRDIQIGIRYPDGTIRWMRVSASPLLDESGVLEGVIGVFSDITEMIEAQKALEESNQRARALFMANPVPTYTWKWTGETFVLIDYNHAAQVFTKGGIVELVGRKASDLYRDRPGIQGSMRRCLVTKASIEEEMPYQLLSTGEPKHLVVKYTYVAPDLVVVYTEDVTDRHQAQEELLRSRDAAVRSHSFLLALSHAAQEVQRARTARQVYQTIGKHVSRLGYHTIVFTPVGDGQHLNVAFTTLQPDRLQVAERLAGLRAASVQVQYEPSGPVGQLLAEGGSIYFDHFPERVILGLPFLARSLVVKLTGMLGIDRAIYAAIRASERTHGLLVVAGTDLTEADRPTVSVLAHQTAIAIENAHLLTELSGSRDRMRQLTRETVTAQEEERRRLSHALHDEAGQALTALRLTLDLMAEDIPDGSDSLRRRMGDVADLTTTTMDQLRLLARDLRPPALDAVGLGPTLAGYCQDYAGRTRLAIDYQGLQVPAPHDRASICLYRFLQEALTNVAKHAQANQVRVRLRSSGDTLSLSVQDDGQGFDDRIPLSQTDRPTGIGLLGMKERLEALDGWLQIESRPGHGTRLVAHVPCRDLQAEGEPVSPA